METELQNLKSNLQKILSLTSGSGGNSSGGGGGDGTKMMELVYSIQSHVDVVQQSASRISSAAEVSFHVQYNKCEKKLNLSQEIRNDTANIAWVGYLVSLLH